MAQRELPSKVNENATSLAREWRRLGRAATAVALLTSPAVFVLFHNRYGWAWPWALLGALAVVVVFRAVVDIVAHRLIPTPSLYGTGSELREDDVISRRRLWYWKRKLRRLLVIGTLLLIVLGAIALINGESLGDAAGSIIDSLPSIATQAIGLGATLVVLFFINFLILFGPFVAMAVQQIKSYEPGEADWGVRLDDVRGQAEAKEEITRVVSLWQSGEEFEKAGGKRERGVLFLGAPGTGKTMLSKAIATSFNCPFVTIPGSGFAQMFMGMDAVTVRILARRAKKMAAKWGGQCIVFIDEIDAVGTRRQSLGSGFQPLETRTVHDMLFYGPDGALTSDGDLVVETAAWRERLFAMRSQPRGPIYPPVIEKLAGVIRHAIVPGMMGGQGSGLALNQLLVVMDGIDEPPLTRRVLTRRLNTFLDALYFVPQRLGRLRLRLKPPRPRKEEVYFVGACNVPLEQLDPALVRPGRMGRHIYFRTPTWEDRRDIFDLYLGKVAHDEDLDTERARDELARITNGYSPAMIDQACSLALTYAHSDGRIAFSRHDLVAAMTTVEAGVAIGQPYPKHEERATAIHEAGHAVCGHLFMESSLSTRLSIRKRGSSGGHHQMMAVEDRFGRWRSEQVGNLIWGLGAMAAEHVFYDQNTTGVGGDVASVTMQAAQMVGMHAMAPAPIDLSDRIPDPEEREAAEKRAMERFERLGEQIMHRSGGGLMDSNPFMATLGDRNKARLVSGLLGQAFVVAWCTVRENREATERIAQRLIDKGELYGDEVTDLLESARLRRPDIDVRDEATWPAI
ncbi:MAG TPA: AAA family ATPase [Solirubrobacteraceae bacterium]|nr:AAA family ATPase [Solirubrobacteraceae bacterium]